MENEVGEDETKCGEEYQDSSPWSKRHQHNWNECKVDVIVAPDEFSCCISVEIV